MDRISQILVKEELSDMDLLSPDQCSVIREGCIYMSNHMYVDSSRAVPARENGKKLR